MIFEVRGMALLQLYWIVPPFPSPRFLSAVIPASGVGMGLQPAPSDGLAQLLYFFLQGSCGSQGPPVGFPYLGEAPFSGGVPPPLLGVLLLGGWTLVRPGSSIVHGGSPPFFPRWSSRVDTTSAVSSSICSSSPRGDPGSLQSLYTS